MVILGAECGLQVCLSGSIKAPGWATRLCWLLLWWWLSPWACLQRLTVVGPCVLPAPPPSEGHSFFACGDGPSANRGRPGHAEWEVLLVLRTQHSEPGRGNRSRLMVTAAGSSPKCCHQDIVCLGVGSDFSGFDFLLGRTLRGPQWSSRASPSQGSGASEIRPISATQELRIQVVTMGP